MHGRDFNKGKRFYAFATRWSRLSREKIIADGKVHGVFTWALLEGLRGHGSEPDGEITPQSLNIFIKAKMESLLTEELLKDPELPLEPYVPKADRFVVAKVQPKKYPVTIHLPPGSAGQMVQLLGDKFLLIAEAAAMPPTWQVPLRKGYYLVQILAVGLQQRFEVSGIGGVDVYF